jgi:hypothetical protein
MLEPPPPCVANTSAAAKQSGQMWFNYPHIRRNAHFARGTLAQPGALKKRKSSQKAQQDRGSSVEGERNEPPTAGASGSSATSVQRKARATAPISWDEMTSGDEERVHSVASLAIAARRMKLQSSMQPRHSLLLAMEAVALATDALERQMEMPIIVPHSMTRREKEEVAKVELAREKLRDGHMLAAAEMLTLERFEQRKEAEARAKRKAEKKIREIKTRAMAHASASGRGAASAASEAKALAVKKEVEAAALAAQKAEEQARIATMDATRRDKEAELIKEAREDDANLVAEIERRRIEVEVAEAARQAEELRLREVAEAKAREEAVQAAKLAEVEAKMEELAAKHAAKANAPLQAQREKEAAEAAAAQANKAKKKPGVPRLSKGGTSSAGSSPANSFRKGEASPMSSHRENASPASARSAVSPPISARNSARAGQLSARSGASPGGARAKHT